MYIQNLGTNTYDGSAKNTQVVKVVTNIFEHCFQYKQKYTGSTSAEFLWRNDASQLLPHIFTPMWTSHGNLGNNTCQSCTLNIMMIINHMSNPLYHSEWFLPHISTTLPLLNSQARTEGVLALYKGFFPAFARMGPWNIIFFVVYEKLQHSYPYIGRWAYKYNFWIGVYF